MDYIPVRQSMLEWDTTENGRVSLSIRHRHFCDRLAQRFFRRPSVSYVEFDELGSYLWTQIDGKKSVSQLASQMERYFGEKAAPAIPRLVVFLSILKKKNYISFQKIPHGYSH